MDILDFTDTWITGSIRTMATTGRCQNEGSSPSTTSIRTRHAMATGTLETRPMMQVENTQADFQEAAVVMVADTTNSASI